MRRGSRGGNPREKHAADAAKVSWRRRSKYVSVAATTLWMLSSRLDVALAACGAYGGRSSRHALLRLVLFEYPGELSGVDSVRRCINTLSLGGEPNMSSCPCHRRCARTAERGRTTAAVGAAGAAVGALVQRGRSGWWWWHHPVPCTDAESGHRSNHKRTRCVRRRLLGSTVV